MGLNNSVNESFRAGSIGSQIHPDDVVHGITIRFSKGAALDDSGGSTRRKDVIDSLADHDVIEL